LTFAQRRTKLEIVKISLLTLALFSILAVLLTGAARAADPVVVITTSMGSITVQLDPAHAPKTVANFLSYVDKKAYDGTIFHRVVPNFMIQGGGFKSDMSEVPTDPPVVNEASASGLKNLRGTITMARTNEPDSATDQFFINLIDDAQLDPNEQGAGYAVFGKVTAGMDVVDKISRVPTTQGTAAPPGEISQPVQLVTIISVRRK
jgi:peptidyl-prolyl cis-trans isomerase A (cyclophilin A)